MLIVLSPAKTLDYATPPTTDLHTKPEFAKEARELVEQLRQYSPAQIASLMNLSDPLAQLNVERYAAWSPRFTAKNSKQAVLAFNGDVYEGLDAPSLAPQQLDYLQRHVRILSGLYGVLRPLDLMQPYRLEMGTRLENARGKDLYAFWGDTVTRALNKSLQSLGSDVLVNLASEEYFKAVRPAELHARIVTPVFEDWKDGRYKIISFFAKQARGAMARYAAIHAVMDEAELKDFTWGEYRYCAEASSDRRWVYRRRIVG